MHSAPVYWVALFVILTSHTFVQLESIIKFRITTKSNVNKTCTTRNNEEGICVHKSMCNNEHEIQIGGRIINSELRRRRRAAYFQDHSNDNQNFRSGGGCDFLRNEWCCTFKNIISTTETARAYATNLRPDIYREEVTTLQPETTAATPRQEQKEQNCVASDRNECPWLVKLYREGQVYPYCLGAFIGSNTILTTASCENEGKNKFLWAQVPSSANPRANITILSMLPHPEYNSDSRLNDIALLTTVTNINWGSDGPKGACIDPKLSLGGECVAANINEYNDLQMVSLLVTEGSCTSSSNVADAMCGNGIFHDLVAGAPIMCKKNNSYVLSGVTKMSYPDGNQALIGNLDYAWLTNNLKTIAGLKETDYSFASSTSPTFEQVKTTTEFKIIRKSNVNKTCTTRNNEEGICVHKSMCNNEHEIQIGGRIINSELRRRRRAVYSTGHSNDNQNFKSGGGCDLLRNEWCCTFKHIMSTTEIARESATNVLPEIYTEDVTTLQPETTAATPRQGQNCRVSDKDNCPWFVKLYRTGEDFPYCLGAVVGSNTILTTAYCERQGQSKPLWAQVPSSENSEANYPIVSRLPHPHYNSGNRLNDIALLTTETIINWGSDGPKEACIDPNLSLGGECVAANINEYIDLDMVTLQVTEGSCTSRGNTADAMCGRGIFDYLEAGAPIMCPKNNVYVLSGVTKMSYPNGNQTLLGKLDYAWLTDNIKTMARLKETDSSFVSSTSPTIEQVKSTTEFKIIKKKPNCHVSDSNDCPWFVKLYGSGEDYPYCVGAAIGSKTILTTATCERQGRSKPLWAQVPNSENPEANYPIVSRLPHPHYNSGNRLNDVALFITETNIDWGSDGAKGACIDPELSLGGDCVAANINEYYDFDMVPLLVTQGSCNSRGNVYGAMCGNGTFDDLVAGAPIMCQKDNSYVLSGITKMSYPYGNQALLGNLDYAWLTDNLKTMAGLKETDYLFKLNYN